MYTLMRKLLLLSLILCCWLFNTEARAQWSDAYSDTGDYYSNSESSDSTRRGGMNMGRNRDKKKSTEAPVGIKMWNVKDDFGTVDSIAIDTVSHMFQNANFTDGLRGEYNTLGNLGSPRESRLQSLRSPYMKNWIFAEPYDFFITPFNKVGFTNTLSPFTNITYNTCGGSQTGEDRLIAHYAINAGKDIGMGFKLDYLYGRGYYDSQATSAFSGIVYANVDKEQYKAHFVFYTNYLKTSENGGIESDEYVTNPENFASSYNSDDIPTRLDRVWNKMYVSGVQLTHRYSVGFRRLLPVPDSIAIRDSLLRVQRPEGAAEADSVLAAPPAVTPTTAVEPIDSTAPRTISLEEFERKWAMGDEELRDSIEKREKPATEFIPVTSFIHTLKIETDKRRLLANEELSSFYTNKYFDCDSARDEYSYLSVSNKLAVELHEGFNKWAVMGVRLFAQHNFLRYGMPTSPTTTKQETFNEIEVGACLFRNQDRYLNYELEGATKTNGEEWGQFYLKANAELKLRLWGDTLRASVYADIINQEPTYYYRRYNSTYLYWNNSLDQQLTTRVGGQITNPSTGTRIALDVRSIKNYVYFANTATLTTDDDGNSYYTYNTSVCQEGGNIQVVCLTLNQDFRLGILNWENQITYQTSSNQDALPLPDLSLYTNLYLKFKIAKVLSVEFGADMRYFTKYYAHDYSPVLGQFVVQDTDSRVKVGNHPVINVYANFHLKHTRFYIMASHVNYSKEGGNVFLAPHYPYDPRIIRFGLSWNFFN